MSLDGLTLLRPWWLLALPPLGLLLWHLRQAPASGDEVWRRLVDAHLLPHLLVHSAPGARRKGLVLFAAGLLAAVLVLAGPALELPRSVAQRNVARLLVLDLSPGMAASLERVKLKLPALLRALADGQTALLVYGGEPYLVVPPTTDVETIVLFVPDLTIGAIPVPGNRPERAMRMAAATLARNGAAQRDVLWITAGATGGESPLTAPEGARLTILHTGDVEDPRLAAVATGTGGTLLRLHREDDDDIKQLVANLTARSGWIAGTRGAGSDAADLGYWLLLPLLPLAALAFRGGFLAMLAGSLLVTGLLLPPPAAALELPAATMLADYQGWRLLEAGCAEEAARRFADPRWRAVANYRAGHFDQAADLLAAAKDADSHYNRGNALAKQGRLADALAAYDESLKQRADDADTRYNRDLVQRLLQQQAQAPQAGRGPAPVPPAAPPRAGEAEREAARVAAQWLQGIPDQPGSLLRRKLLAEQQRRQAGVTAPPW